MAELEEKLNAILGNPEAMGQIVSIAKALSGGEEEAPPPEPDADLEEDPSGSPPAAGPDDGESQPDWGALLGLLGLGALVYGLGEVFRDELGSTPTAFRRAARERGAPEIRACEFTSRL